MTDTEPKMQMKLDAMMRTKTGVERLKMGCSMFDMSKKLVIASIHACNNDNDIPRQLLIRFYRGDLDSKTIDKVALHLRSIGR